MSATHHHPDAGELEQFVRGELEGPRLAPFEAHVASCDACAAALVREARLELALVELGATTPAAPPRPRWSRRAGAAIAIAAAAAVVVLAVRRDDGVAGDGVRAIPRVVCADGAGQVACIERAHRHGLVVDYPGWAGQPPLGSRDRVGASGPARYVVGPSRPPFASAPVER